MAKKRITTKRHPLFTRTDFMRLAKRFSRCARDYDGRTVEAREYKKLAAMLAWADANLPDGIPDSANRARKPERAE